MENQKDKFSTILSGTASVDARSMSIEKNWSVLMFLQRVNNMSRL